mmetsp:Transcript_12325/g.23941  ORF Transcript_12325/g.23941 Transcript_12325/m.23941 type:complete len:81 (+) Transcript_12325:58-300(+)
MDETEKAGTEGGDKQPQAPNAIHAAKHQEQKSANNKLKEATEANNADDLRAAIKEAEEAGVTKGAALFNAKKTLEDILQG